MKLPKIPLEFQIMTAMIALFIGGAVLGYLVPHEEKNHAPGYYYNPYNKQNVHVCKDPTHVNCDGVCECDGLECPRMRDYQIEITQDGTFFYDDSRFVGFIPYSGKSEIDSLLNQDNQ